MPQLLHEYCQIEGCGRKHKARGLCAVHYQHHLRGVPINPVIRERDRNPPAECTERGCHGPVVARSLCKMHYARLLRHGHTKRPDRTRVRAICSELNCDSFVFAKGFCHQHWQRPKKLWSKFGLTEERYAKLLAEQDGKCSICLKLEARLNWRSQKPTLLSVDHNHTTGDVRGLLCTSCNRALGLFGDSLETLRSAVTYLERHKST